MVVEAVIAAPLWAIMHVHPDGEGLTGKAGNGYGLVLTVVLRPGLMIFGFVAAIVLMYPIGAFINQTFASVFQMSVGISGDASANPKGVSATLTMLAGAFIYVGVMTTLVNKVFSLIHMLPDQLIRWIGGQGNNFGSGMEQEALGGARAGIGQVGQAQSGYQAAAYAKAQEQAERERLAKAGHHEPPTQKQVMSSGNAPSGMASLDSPVTVHKENAGSHGGSSSPLRQAPADGLGQSAKDSQAAGRDAGGRQAMNVAAGETPVAAVRQEPPAVASQLPVQARDNGEDFSTPTQKT